MSPALTGFLNEGKRTDDNIKQQFNRLGLVLESQAARTGGPHTPPVRGAHEGKRPLDRGACAVR
jgi:hypothetical protein